MKVYVAAPWPCRERARLCAAELTNAGHQVTSRWLVEEGDLTDPMSQQRYALKDLEDVGQADVLLLLTGYDGPRSHTGGRHVEFGWAVASGLRTIVCPQPENVFHYLPNVVHCPTMASVIGVLAEFQNQSAGRQETGSAAADRRSTYMALQHAMQTGVGYTMELNQQAKREGETSPKHLRVGVNTALNDTGALAALLTRKGVISIEEYDQLCTSMMRDLVEDYERRLSHYFGREVKLG